MQFNSYFYIMAFLPIFVVGYFLLGNFSRFIGKLWIVAGSLLFYYYSGVYSLAVLVVSITANYLFFIASKNGKHKKLFTAVPILINITLLLYFKYTDFAISNINGIFSTDFSFKNIALPLGISFFTFQQISFIVSAYKGEITNTGFLDYLAYILYFPKILMGPLTEPADFFKQLNSEEIFKPNWQNIASGVKLFSFGLFKKVFIADTFAKAVGWGFENIEIATASDLLLVMFFYTLEIYFDFSGYSDMAIGSSLLLNIKLPINFDSPYKAVSVRDFWKRWHISLTKFFTKYVYIPLGGSRKGLAFTCFNTMLVFLISGLWHGANTTFILWGLLHGIFSVIDRVFEKPLSKLFQPLRWLLTFIIVSVLWLLFRSDSISQWIFIVKKILMGRELYISNNLIDTFYFSGIFFFLNELPLLGYLNSTICRFVMNSFIAVSCFLCFVPENNYKTMTRLSVFELFLASAAIIWGITCLGEESVFIYNNF